MEWVAPPAGSAADRVLDNLGRMRKADWERACRWCPGWDIAGARRLAEEAARGGDERLAWYVPTLEARDRRAPKKMILRRLGVRSGGAGRGRTRGGRLTGSRRVGGAPGPRSRASSSCRTRARATWRCGWRSGMRSGRGCRGRCEGRAGDRLARDPLPALRRALADGLRQGRAEGREPRDTLLQVRGDARDADRHGAAGAGKGVRMKSRKRRYHRRERRKAKASRWRRLPKSNPRKVGHGPN